MQCKFKKYCCIICSLELIYVLVFNAIAFLQDIYEIFAGIYDSTKIEEALCENAVA